MNLIKAWLLAGLIVALAACSDDKDNDKDKSDLGALNNAMFSPLAEPVVTPLSTSIKIVDTMGQPVGSAVLLIGSEVDNPFKGNQAVSDVNGEVAIPKNWTTALPVTIEAPGHTRITYNHVEPLGQDLEVHKTDGANFIEVKGETTDYGRLRRDGFIDFSLIIPAFTQRSMIDFDLTSVISPVSDTISVAGRSMDLPSNISLPRQQESYIIPITFEKPVYRAFVRNPGFYKMFATHGKFPFKKIIDEFRGGKSVFEVINYFDFLGGGQKDLQVNQALTGQDISIRQVAFDQEFEVRAPNYSNQYEMVSLALVNQGGYYYPADLKRVTAGSNVSLKYPASQTDTFVLSALVNKDAVPMVEIEDPGPDFIDIGDTIDIRSFFTPTGKSFMPFANVETKSNSGLSISLSFERADATRPVSFIDFVDAPKINGNTLTLDAPTIGGIISPVATYVTLSEVESIGSGKVQSEKRTQKWQILEGGWVRQIELPNLKMDIQPNKSYRWEVLFLGRKGTSPAQGGHLLDGITHISRSSYNF